MKILALPVGAILFLASIKYYKQSLVIFFIWVLLEGVFRKWYLNDYATPVFFIKYVLLIGPFIRCVTSYGKITKRDYPFFVILVLYFIWGFIEFANFTLTSNVIVKALGFITHYWFISLIFLIPVFLNDEEKILRFFKILVVLSIPIFILGIIQYNSPVYSEINKYVAEGVEIAKIRDKPRITTVFSYIIPFTSFLGFTIMIILYLIVLRKHKLYFELILITAGGLSLINLFMTGSRGILFFILFKIGLLRVLKVYEVILLLKLRSRN